MEPYDKEELSKLTLQLAEARRDESEAKNRRVQTEEAIVALLQPGDKQTLTVEDGNGLKITVKTELGYKADVVEIERIDSDLLKITTKAELDVKAYEALREANPALFEKVSEHVTVTPKKPTLTLKVA